MDEQIYLSTPLLPSQEATYGLIVALSVAKALRSLMSHWYPHEDQIYYSVLRFSVLCSGYLLISGNQIPECKLFY